MRFTEKSPSSAMLRTSNAIHVRLSLITLLALTLSGLLTGSVAAPIDSISGNPDIVDRSGSGLINPGARVGRSDETSKRSPAIVKHVKKPCDGPICNHAAFYD
ncbi:uncharacterized protein UTRI_04570 [Ustilago trichophora]|uniref:Uncharacterized protein n=1 Tax=Ustilago trichophora TaxID=86804 RepID=A0A5C3EDW3_9BASI|nr:uncharacterized protein UTRI_04570 [Ustilago trichophora]